MALPRKYRLTKDKEIRKVNLKGQTIKGPLFVVKLIENNLEHSRIAVIVSKKVSNKAVDRNLVKRRITESLTTIYKNFLKINFDITITAIPAILGKPLKEIKSNLDQTTKKIL